MVRSAQTKPAALDFFSSDDWDSRLEDTINLYSEILEGVLEQLEKLRYVNIFCSNQFTGKFHLASISGSDKNSPDGIFSQMQSWLRSCVATRS